jgi:methionine synthase II (cobalamin-independent)
MSIRTTAVGSWWIPEALAPNLERYHKGEIEGEAAEQLLKDAAALAVIEQRNLGLLEWTGGEYSSELFIEHISRVLSGVTVTTPRAEYIFDYDDGPMFEITGEISAPAGLGFARAYIRERDVPGGVTKATCVGPLTMLSHTLSEGIRAETDVLPLDRACAIVNAELRALEEAGCPHIVLDEPVLGGLVNAGRLDVDKAADIVAACFEGVTCTRGIHICNGNLRGRPSSAILRNASWVPVLQRLEGVIDIASLECHYFSEYLEREAMGRLPQSMQLAAGIVDEANYAIEPVKKIQDRAADWARVMGEERLWISMSCGFGRHPASDRSRLLAKVENMVTAAAAM